MRILLSTCALVCCVVFCANAQVGFSLEIGSNYSKYKFDNLINAIPDARVDFYTAIIPKVRLSEKLSLLPEFQFSQEGYSDNSYVAKKATNKFRYGYVRIIPQLDYEVLNGLNVFGGLNLGRKMFEAFRDDFDPWRTIEFDTVTRYNMGLVAGARLTIKRVFISAKYNYGLSDISNLHFTDDEGKTIKSASQKTRNLQLGIGCVLIR